MTNQAPGTDPGAFIFAACTGWQAFGTETPRVPLRDEVVETQLLRPQSNNRSNDCRVRTPTSGAAELSAAQESTTRDA